MISFHFRGINYCFIFKCGVLCRSRPFYLFVRLFPSSLSYQSNHTFVLCWETLNPVFGEIEIDRTWMRSTMWSCWARVSRSAFSAVFSPSMASRYSSLSYFFHFLFYRSNSLMLIPISCSIQVLHMDRNDYYGGESTSLNLIQVFFHIFFLIFHFCKRNKIK